MNESTVVDDELADEKENTRDSAATKLIALANGFELFHNSTRDAYATVTTNGHQETMRVASKVFRQYLSLEFFRTENRAPSPQALAASLQTIEAKAVFDGSPKDVHARVAQTDRELWLDLCNESWEAVEITSDGWRIVKNPPVKFVRPAGMLPLPRPVNGSIRDLEPFTTLRGDGLVLVIGYLLGCLRERGPFPILVLVGEQGSGKTTLSRLLKRTIDPSKAITRCLPKDERDLMIAAEGQHILALDNLSHVDGQMSDALCRLATGGGLSTRTLYSDRDETVFDCERPIIANAITDVFSRPDLIDRSAILNVPPLEESKRRPEHDFWRDFDKIHPRILGALCSAASLALGETKSISVPSVRMADFCLFVSRGEDGLGLKRGAFLKAYQNNRRDANEVAVDLSPVAQSLKRFLEAKNEWTGTAGELLKELQSVTTDDVRRLKEWPKTPRGLSGAIRRIVPNLRSVGVVIKTDIREPGTGNRLIEIKYCGKPSQPPHPSQSQSTVTTEHIENTEDAKLCDDRDGCDGLDCSPESVTVQLESESLFDGDWEVL